MFDLDGTLVDSAAVAASSVRAACEFHGLRSDSIVGRFLGAAGTPLDDVCTQLGLPSGFAESFRSASVARQGELSLFPGIGDLLSELDSIRIPMGILTGKDRPRTLSILRQLEIDRFFGCVVTPDDPPEPKPSGAGVIWICTVLQSAPIETLVVGDSTLDILSGADAGAWTVGCTWGVADHAELATAGADLIVESVASLRAGLLARLR